MRSFFFFQFSVINPHLKTRSMKTAVHCPWEGGSLYKRDFFFSVTIHFENHSSFLP